MDKPAYNCIVTLGNVSTFETDFFKESMDSFLASFNCKDVEIEKFPIDDHSYYFEYDIKFENFSFIKVQRFVEALVAFCLFSGFRLSERNLAL